MNKKRIYLDYNATTPLHPEVIKAIRVAEKSFGNPSSLHATGRQAKAMLEDSRATIAEALGAVRENMIFTASGSEGNNQVIKSVLFQSLIEKKPAHIISSQIEHSSIREALKQVQKMGVDVSLVGCDASGRVNPADVQNALRDNTRLISIQFANNEVGSIQPIKEIVEISRAKKGCLVHTDAVQAFGKIEINAKDIGVDFLSVSAHKVYGPKGIGALYVKNDETLLALVSGSSHERKLRAGTEAVPQVVGFAKAVSLLRDWNTEMRDYLIRQIQLVFPDCVIHTPLVNSLANTISIGFPGYDAHALAINLDLAGVDVSTGSACSSGSVEPSPVLSAMGVPVKLNKSSIRLSLGTDTSQEDIHGFIEALKKIIRTGKKI